MLDIMLLFGPKIVGMYKESIYSLKCIQQKYDSDHTFYNITTTTEKNSFGMAMFVVDGFAVWNGTGISLYLRQRLDNVT